MSNTAGFLFKRIFSLLAQAHNSHPELEIHYGRFKRGFSAQVLRARNKTKQNKTVCIIPARSVEEGDGQRRVGAGLHRVDNAPCKASLHLATQMSHWNDFIKFAWHFPDRLQNVLPP